MCKQESLEADNLNFINSDQFVQLPQLESPSLPLIKRSNSISLSSIENNSNNNGNSNSKEYQGDQQQINRGCNNNNSSNNKTKQVTDWRALDKFVASQLSQEDQYDHGGHNHGASSSNFGIDNISISSSEMDLLLLQSRREEENKLNGFLNISSSDCDIGICVFEK